MRAGALLLSLMLIVSPAGAATLEYRDCHRLGVELRGLSGITHGGEDRYYAVADNSDRVYPIAVSVSGDAKIEGVEVQRPWLMKQRGDNEGVALSRGGDSLFISDESPAIGEYLLPGLRRTRALPVPEVFSRHIVPNQGLESLTISDDGKTLWTANERALAVDGNRQTPATPMLAITRVRLLRYEIDGAKATPREQYEYQTSGVHDSGGQIGLCDLAALPDGRLLALERSAAKNFFSGKASIRTRIFLVDVSGATDISGPPYDHGLVGADGVAVEPAPVTVSKTLLFDGFVCDADGENLEGLCLGRTLGEGRFAVIGVVDSGDGGLGVSQTALVSFELRLDAHPPPPATTQAR